MKNVVVSSLPFESFVLSFCIVLLKSLLITQEPHSIGSEANHMFDKTK